MREMEQQGIYERIRERVGQLKAESRDHYFTEYLSKFDSRLIQEKHNLDLLELELERSCQLYRQRMEEAGADRPQMPAGQESLSQAEPFRAEPQGETKPVPPQIYGTYSAGSAPQQTAAFRQPQKDQRPAGNKTREFTVGISVFGTIGVLFVLAALILLGINYMNDIVKAAALYAVSLLVWGAAEFGLKKKSRILSMIFSALGIGSLYVTTMVNFFYLENFNGLAAILITVLITVAVMIVSRKKDAGILRIICIGACMISFLMIVNTLDQVSDWELLVYMAMILLVQLLGILLPVKKWAYGIGIGQIVGAAVFAFWFAAGMIYPELGMELRVIYMIGFIVLSILLIELIVWRMPADSAEKVQGIYIAFGISAGLLLWAHGWCAGCDALRSDREFWIRLGVMASIAVMGILFFFLTRRRGGGLCWMQGYYVAGAALLMFGCGPAEERLSVTVTLSVLLILYKLLAYRMKLLRAADAIITVWTVLAVWIYHDSIHGYVLLCVLLLSVLLMNHWQTFFELLVTGALVLYIPMVLDNDLVLPTMIAVMWLAELLFNTVKRFSGKGIVGFNYTVLTAEAICYLTLITKDFDRVILYVVLTVLGLGIILYTFQNRSHMAVKWRGLVISGFLTYMVLVSRFEYRIVSSILMLLVGLVSIILGFTQEDKKLRIYGLVLCLLTCFKITLYDFRVQDLQRIILFLAAGVVALIIAGIYA
ncbi:MAG: hypothetical protein J6B43_12675, partial [Lachnospiraceae bacterium]|nr:hypothetical protein [Lachnospiraceae bacterium]